MRIDTLSHPPVPRRREGDREVRVGLFVLLGLLASIVLLFALTDASMFRGRYKVTTRVEDAGGVRKGDPVQLRGVNVGRIHGFKMVPGGVELSLELEGDYRVPVDSRVELASGGLLGGRVAVIEPGSAPQLVRDGAQLRSKGGEEAASVLDSVDTLTQRAQGVLGQVQKLLSDETVSQVHSSTAALEQTLTELSRLTREQGEQVRALTKSLRASAQGLEKAVAGPELERSIARLDRMTAQMETTLGALDRSSRSLEVALGRIERGEGTLGRLSRDDSLYRHSAEAAANLNRLTAEMQALVQDVKANPRRYINLEIF